MAVIERQSLLNKEISAADSRPKLFVALRQVMKAFGLSHFTLMAIPQEHDMMISTLIVDTTMSARFIRDFDRNGYLRCCPTAAKICSSVLPQCWTIDEELIPPGMVKIMRNEGVTSGVMVPATSVSGDRFVMRFDGDMITPDQVDINELGMIALHAFDVYDSLRRTENVTVRPLTKRELEVIRWTAQGKTSAEIGQILSLSDHTINAYMNNAIKKLDCVNRTQLVAKAIRMKLIN